MGKVLVFGIDGAMPEMIFGEWLDELPNIKRLMEQGCYARLNSTIPPVSGSAWIGMLTGKSPADHGIFEYIYRKNYSYHDVHVTTSYNIRSKTIWEILSERGKESIISFIPVTYPPRPLKGILITGPMTPQTEDVECTYPKELKQEIKEVLGESLTADVPDFKNFRNLPKPEIVKEIYRLSKMHIKTMKYLIKNKEWDLFFTVINGSDRLNHMFWRYMDKKHRKYEPDSEFENVLKDYYKFVDKELGEILEGLDEDVKVIVVSDHGITRMHNRVNLTDWLIKEGYMVLKEPVTEKKRFSFDLVDWGKTKVFAIGAYDAQIFINLRGREPEGIVEREEYRGLIKELEGKLKEISGDDGWRLDTHVFVKKRDYDGKAIEEAPDMVIYFDDLQYGCNTTLVGNETLWSPSTAQGSDDAAHSKQGIFIMNKSERKGDIGEVSYLDIAPTILDGLGEEIPEDMGGEVVGGGEVGGEGNGIQLP